MKSLRLLILICMALGIKNLGAAWTALANRSLYQELETAGDIRLRVLFTGGWGIVFLWLSWRLWRRDFWAHRLVMPLLLMYTVFSFCWFAVFVRAVYDSQRVIFVGVTSGLGLCFSYWLHTRTRTIFGESIYDQ